MCLFGCDYGVSAITGLTVGAVSPQEIMPGPVSLVYTVSADHCHIVLGQGVTENNSKCLFFLTSSGCVMGGVYHFRSAQIIVSKPESKGKIKKAEILSTAKVKK